MKVNLIAKDDINSNITGEYPSNKNFNISKNSIDMNLESIREKNKKEFLSIVKKLQLDKIELENNCLKSEVEESSYMLKAENNLNSNLNNSKNIY